MKILMLIPVWKRPEILRLFLRRMEAVKPDYAELKSLFILSPEDPDLNVIEHMLQMYDCLYYPNDDLGEKLNAGITFALKTDWDYLMNIGSDNIYTPLLWEIYRDYFETREKYFSINDFYCYDIVNERACYFNGFVDEEVLGGIGAGRMINRSILEDDPCIYRPHTSSGMDGFSAFYLSKKGHIQKIVPTEGRPVMLDIKTNTNINHSMEIWSRRNKDVKVDWIKNNFGLMDEINDTTFNMLSFNGFHSEVIKLCQKVKKEDAFNSVNVRYEIAFGKPRFKNCSSYEVQVSKQFKR